jgi:hypothetical protein
MIAATNLDTNTIYNLTGGPSSNVLIVFPTAANAISDGAINLTTGEFGEYDITGNTFTAQGGGGGNPDAITIQARNNNASPITRGQLVYAVPGTGSQLNVDLARANSASTSNVIGMVSAASINAGSVGEITLFGLVTQLDTNVTTEGSVLYLSAATAGARTDTVPAAPNYEVRIGTVDIQSTTVGKVVFHPSEPLSQQVILSEIAAPTTDAVIREMRQGLTTFNGVPGTGQDSTQGYTANKSRIIDYNTQIKYLCTNAGVGAAVWAVVDSFLPLAGGSLSGAVNNAKGTDIASASTTNIAAATGNYVVVTGTTTITALGTAQAGTMRTVRFSGALTLTHNATSLILPTGANIVTTANDIAVFASEGSGNWRCVQYQRANGSPLDIPGFVFTESTSIIDFENNSIGALPSGYDLEGWMQIKVGGVEKYIPVYGIAI